jgi:hypothetical protein
MLQQNVAGQGCRGRSRRSWGSAHCPCILHAGHVEGVSGLLVIVTVIVAVATYKVATSQSLWDAADEDAVCEMRVLGALASSAVHVHLVRME